ncbi:MAG: T9SS C-terminal target domain-containing protein [Ignavibacteriae bacterium]|nr:MAG: T9SS C-terminal target domain-containing protein [Ignavibacteriota bacterium]
MYPNVTAPAAMAAFENGVMFRTVARGQGNGLKFFLLRSTDDGASWRQVDPTHQLKFTDLVKAHGLLYALDLDQLLYVSTDQGLTWEQLPLPPGYPADTTISLSLSSDHREHAIVYSKTSVWRLTHTAPWYENAITAPTSFVSAGPTTDGMIVINGTSKYVILPDTDVVTPWSEFENSLPVKEFIVQSLIDGKLWLIHSSGDGYLFENGSLVRVKKAINEKNWAVADYVDDDIVIHGLEVYYRDRPDSVFTMYEVLPEGAPTLGLSSSFVAGDRKFLDFGRHVFEITSVKPLVLTERWYYGPSKELGDGSTDHRIRALANGTLLSSRSAYTSSFCTSVDGGLSWHTVSTDSVRNGVTTGISVDREGVVYLNDFIHCWRSDDGARSFQAYDGPMCNDRIKEFIHHEDGSISYKGRDKNFFRSVSNQAPYQELPALKGQICAILNANTVVRFRPNDYTRIDVSTDDGDSWQEIAEVPLDTANHNPQGLMIRLNDHEVAAVQWTGVVSEPSRVLLINTRTGTTRIVYEGLPKPVDIIRPSDRSIRIALANASIFERFEDGTSRLHIDPHLGVYPLKNILLFRLTHTDGVTYMADERASLIYRLAETDNVTDVPSPEQAQLSLLQIYPNPTSSSVTFEGPVGVTSAQIFDLTGTSVVSTTFGTDDTSATHTIDVSDLANGTFLLVVRDANGRAFARPLQITK